MTDETPPRGRRAARRRNVASRVNVSVASTSGSSVATSGKVSQVVSSRQHIRVVQRDGRTEVNEVKVVVEDEDPSR